MVLMLEDTPGMIAPAATATKPAISAYSIRSWPRVSLHTFSFNTKLVICVIVSPPNAKESSVAIGKLSPEHGTLNQGNSLRTHLNSPRSSIDRSWYFLPATVQNLHANRLRLQSPRLI